MINQAIGLEPNLWFSQTRPCSFYPELYSEFNKATKCHHIPRGLGPKNKFWAILAKMIYQATSPEPM